MPSSPTESRARYPLMAYNFKVTVGGASLSFSEVTGLAREHLHVTYRHGLSFREGEDLVKYSIDHYVSITMKRGIMLGADELYRWLEQRGERPIEIGLCDENGAAVVIWRVAKAVAIKLEAPGFNADTNEVAIESLEVMASGITVNTPASGGFDSSILRANVMG
jgi:phage tail-like protein